MKEKKHSRDLILILGILIIACIFFATNWIRNQKPAVMVEVTVDGTVVGTFDLNKDTETVIQGYNGGTNTLIIEDGKAYVLEASCPDKICIHQGKISQSGEMIVCLPNRMIAKIVGDET